VPTGGVEANQTGGCDDDVIEEQIEDTSREDKSIIRKIHRGAPATRRARWRPGSLPPFARFFWHSSSGSAATSVAGRRVILCLPLATNEKPAGCNPAG